MERMKSVFVYPDEQRIFKEFLEIIQNRLTFVASGCRGQFVLYWNTYQNDLETVWIENENVDLDHPNSRILLIGSYSVNENFHDRWEWQKKYYENLYKEGI